MKVVIGFSRPKSRFALFAWTIRLALGGTKYSHSYISYYDSTVKDYMIFEASAPSVHKIPKKEFLKKNIIVKEFNICLNEHLFVDGLSKAILLRGTPYGLKAVFGVAIRWLFNINRNPYDDDERTVFCSEFVAIILKEWGYKIDKDTDLVTPKDIYNLVKKDISCTFNSLREG